MAEQVWAAREQMKRESSSGGSDDSASVPPMDGAHRLDAIDGEALLEQAGRIHVHALGLLERLERDYVSGSTAAADVVRALREVRGSLETLGKFFVMVEDRPKKADASSRPEIDDAIILALRARDVDVAAQGESASHWSQYREPMALPAASS